MSTTKYIATFALLCPLLAQTPQGLPKNGFPQPAPPISVTISAIPGVVAAGVTWQKAWEGEATADGITATKDGGLLMAQEQTDQINSIDKNGKTGVFLKGVHGPGSVAYDSKGRLHALERSCTDPGKPGPCNEPTGVAIFAPDRKVIANSIGKMGDGKSMGRVNDFTIAKSGHIYITSGGPAGPALQLTPAGEVKQFGQNLRSNGLVLSPDEKLLYITNGATVDVFDIQPDGSVANQREFGKLTGMANGDGMAVDAEGRIYVTCNTPGNWGVQVFDKTGKNLGNIPTPRAPITVAFSGKNKKELFIGSMGLTKADGTEFLTSPNVRNTAMTVYKIPMLTSGVKGRLK